jgi:DNA ligase-1
VADGCEGLLCKSLSATAGYQAGACGWLWIKLKRDYRTELSDTLDLVVVGALSGRGRRAGIYAHYQRAKAAGVEVLGEPHEGLA